MSSRLMRLWAMPESQIDPNGMQQTGFSGMGNPTCWDNLGNDGNLNDATAFLFDGKGGPSGGSGGMGGDISLGGGGGVTSYHNEEAIKWWAKTTGNTPAQGQGNSNTNFEGDNSTGGGSGGFDNEQVQQAGWTVDSEDDAFISAHRYVQDGDLTTLRREGAKFTKNKKSNWDKANTTIIGAWGLASGVKENNDRRRSGSEPKCSNI